MKSSTSDRIEGRFHEAKGEIKQAVGQVVGNPDLETEGRIEQLGGKVQSKVAQIEKVFEK